MGETSGGNHAVIVDVGGGQAIVPLRRSADGALADTMGVVGAARLVRCGDDDESEDALRWPTVLEMGPLTGAGAVFELP